MDSLVLVKRAAHSASESDAIIFLIICDMVIIAPLLSFWLNFCAPKRKMPPRSAAGLRLLKVRSVTVNTDHHVALFVYYCCICMCGALI